MGEVTHGTVPAAADARVGARAPAPVPAATPAPALTRLGAAAADSLRKTVKGALTTLLDDFVQRLTPAITELELKAGEYRELQAARELRSRFAAISGRWAETFLHQIDVGLVGSGARAESAASMADDALVLGSAELRAEERYRELLSELEQRFAALHGKLYVPIHVRALAPAGLVRALQDTAELLGWPTAQLPFLLARFDDWVVPRLGGLYRALAVALRTIGTAAEQATTTAAPPSLPPPTTTPEARVDTGTRAMLQAYAARAHHSVYDDHALAADLLLLVDDQPLPGLDQPEQRQAPLQRMNLAGQFLSEAIADPLVDPGLRARHEAVRLPVVKVALSDHTLFTSPAHPIGSLVNDLMLKSATARVTGNVEERRAAERLEQVLTQFDLAPDFVREAMLRQQPIDEVQVRWFLEARRNEAQARRESVINAVRRRVRYELELSSFGRRLPAPLQTFLHKVWGPLLMKRLLDHGADDPRWTQALELLDQLVGAFDQRDAQPACWQEVLQALTEQLASAGMKAERIGPALALLDG